tara:strand:- start:982 stop:1251 length:270 start_codon:yes stop_codon:yes gene_type:complete
MRISPKNYGGPRLRAWDAAKQYFSSDRCSSRKGVSEIGICRCSSGVEYFLGKEEVTGSNPVIGSRLNADALDKEVEKTTLHWFKYLLSN